MPTSRSAAVLLAAAATVAGTAVALAPTMRRQARAVAAIDPDLRHAAAYVPFTVGPAVVRLSRLVPAVPARPMGDIDVQAMALPPAHGLDGVDVRVYQPAGRRPGGGALLWIHGGGYVLGAAAFDDRQCADLAGRLGVLVVSVDYRLAPEHPFPAAHRDCLRALRWLHDEHAALGIDPGRIAVGGESAGGGLAAGLVQRAHDDGLPVCFQYLVYPMLDDRTVRRAEAVGAWHAVWSPRSNRFGWTAYLGRDPGGDEDRPYAVPARRDSLAGLPPAWIGVGSADLFADEDADYARRLRDDGVDCRLHVVPGMYHGAPRFSPGSAAAQEFIANGERALAAALAPRST